MRVRPIALMMCCAAVANGLAAQTVTLTPPTGDATELVQTALDTAEYSDITLKAGTWVVEPLYVRRPNVTLRLADGATLLAKKDAFKGLNDVLLTANNLANDFALLGEGRAMLKMHGDDYRDASKYTVGEWRHGLMFLMCSNVVVRGISVVGAGGDGLSVRGTQAIVVEDCNFVDCNRLGAGIIAVNGLTIRRCVFAANNGTAPKGGIDFEPNNEGEFLKDVLMEDCVFSGHDSCGCLVFLANLTTNSAPISITLRRCAAKNSGNYGYRVTASNGPQPVAGYINFEDCRTINSRVTDFSFINAYSNGVVFATNGCQFATTDVVEWVPDVEVAEWRPAELSPLNTSAGMRDSQWFRNNMSFVQLAPTAGTYRVKFVSQTYGSAADGITIGVYDQVGTPLEVLKFDNGGFGDGGYTYEFTTTGKNCRQFEVTSGGHIFRALSEHPGAGLRVNEMTHILGNMAGRKYAFRVPAQCERVTVALQSEESFEGMLINAQGEVVADVIADRSYAKYMLEAVRTPTLTDELWTVKFTNVVEDAYFKMGTPCAPYVEIVP